MHYILRQVIPDTAASFKPLEIFIRSDEVKIGRKYLPNLARYLQISRDHARFYKSEDGSLFVKNMSLNGVYVNDILISQSLKPLKVGDVIGFGVPSAKAEEGLVCVLAEDHPTAYIKPEVVELCDEWSDTEIDSIKRTDSESIVIVPVNPTADIKEETTEWDDASVVCVDSFTEEESDEPPTSYTSFTNHFYPAAEIKPEVIDIRTDSESTAMLSVNPTADIAQKAAELRDDVSVVCVDSIKQEVIDLCDFHVSSVTSDKSEENVPLKVCSIPLKKCDSEVLECALDVKNSLLNVEKSPVTCRRKRVKVISSDSSENEESNVLGFDCNLTNPKEQVELPSKIAKYTQCEKTLSTPGDELYLDSPDNFLPGRKELNKMKDYYSDENCSEAFLNDERHSESLIPHNIGKNSIEESVESVVMFLNENQVENHGEFQTSVFLNPMSDIALETSSDVFRKVIPPSDNNQIRCAPSENFDCVREDSDSSATMSADSSRKGHMACSDKNKIFSDPATNRPKNKSESKIKEINPKLTQNRPRRRTDKFLERNQTLDLSSGVQKRKRGRPRKNDPKSMRIACENEDSGGSGVLPKKRGRPRKIRSEAIEPKPAEKTSEIPGASNHVSCVPAQSPSSRVSANSENIRQKKSSVKTRSEKQSSRMGFLSNELQSNPQTKRTNSPKVCKNKSSVNRIQLSSANANEIGEKQKPQKDKRLQKFDIVTKKSDTLKASSSNNSIPISKDPRLLRTNTSSELELKNSKLSSVSRKTRKETAVTATSLSEQTCNEKSQICDVSFHGLLKTLLKLDTGFLQRQVDTEILPSVLLKGVVDLPLIYDTYDSYVSSFYPLFLLETWEFMVAESRAFSDTRSFYFSVLSSTKKDDCIELKCEAVLNDNAQFFPFEGGIVTLEMLNESKTPVPLFGYTFKHKVQPLNLSSLNKSHWKNLPNDFLKNAQKCTFNAYIKEKEMLFSVNSILKGNGVCNIWNKLKLADSLRFVKVSPLLTDILKPRLKTFSVGYSAGVLRREYSYNQSEIINGVTAAICEPFGVPKIILLSGGPGTGKTHAIIGIMEMLFFNSKHSDQRILITAPSDIVVDEIGFRLIELFDRYSWKGRNVQFVRVGSEKYIHHRMLPYFIDRRASDLQKLNSSNSELTEKELQSLRAEMSNLEKEVPSVDRNDRLKYLKDQYEYLKCKRKKMEFYAAMEAKAEILKESSIVLSTLSSCGCSLLRRNFQPDSDVNFSCCIVDESTQSTEIEILQPLMFGISKLILVGDNTQLPANVLSNISAQRGLKRSMFDRFQKYFESFGEENPTQILNEQFRMHSSICDFPSRRFYGSKLVTDIATLNFKDFPLYPFAVLNVMDSQKTTSILLREAFDESQIILGICQFLVKFSTSIGIIVPFRAQRLQYTKVLYQHPSFREIEINTVEAFQGREKDVIILSTLKADAQPEGMRFLKCRRRFAVAITRARKCLIICGQTDTLKSFPEWAALIEDSQKRELHFNVEPEMNIISSELNSFMLKSSE